MVGGTGSLKGVFVELLTPIILNIGRELTIEALIDLNWLISRYVESVVWILRGFRNGHLALKMKSEEYMEHTGYTFVPRQNSCSYPQTMGATQEQALGTEEILKNQALFRRYTTVDGSLKKQIVTAVQPVSCPHWWASWQDLDRFPCSPCYNIYSPHMRR